MEEVTAFISSQIDEAFPRPIVEFSVLGHSGLGAQRTDNGSMPDKYTVMLLRTQYRLVPQICKAKGTKWFL